MAGLLLLVSCRSLPPLPPVDSSAFSPAVREQIQLARQVAETNPADGDAAGRLGMLYHVYQLDSPAIVCYRRAHSLDPRNPRWPHFHGLIALRQSRFPEAVDFFRAVVQLAPTLPAPRLHLAEALAGDGKREDAVRLYREMIQSAQALPYAHLGLGRLLAAQGQVDAAIVELRQACSLAPGFKEARFALAQALRRQGDAAGAEEHLALHRSGGNLAPPLDDAYRQELLLLDRSSLGYINRSVAYDQAGQLRLAIEELRSCLVRHPGNTNAQVNLISLYARTGDFSAAEASYRQAIAAKPDEPNAHFYWANTLAAQGRLAEAVPAVEKTLALSPEFPRAATLLGDLLLSLGRAEAAEIRYREALRRQPADPVASLGLGRILARRGASAEALSLLEAARAAPGHAAVRAIQELDTVYGRLGLDDKRFASLERAEPVFLSHGTPDENRWLRERLGQRNAPKQRP